MPGGDAFRAGYDVLFTLCEEVSQFRMLGARRHELIDRKADWRAWKAVLREAGVRDVRLHDGRHTAATVLLSEGVHPRVVMEILGHAQMRTTTDTYSHVMPALGRDAADRMGRALWD